MFTRLTHAAIAFAVTAVMYQAYVLAVVPFVEPAWIAAHPTILDEQSLSEGADALDKYKELLAAYFPANHWCFARPPKILENGRILAVFDDYLQKPNGELTIPRCAVVFFPNGRDRSSLPPRDAIVMEPAQGAVLQMEQAVDKATSGFGRMQFGQLQGEVIVRSDMREPGAHDDLRVVTRNIYMNEDLIRTDQTVDMQLGEHRAFGRELEIRRVKTDGSARSNPGGLYGSFEDLVIKHDVSLVIAPNKLQFAANDGQATPAGSGAAGSGALSGSAATTDAAAPQPAPPIRIKCAGAFRIDFGSYKAVFSDQVRAWQIHADGKMDELLAHELTLFFMKTTAWNDDASAASDPASTESLALEPASIEARGTDGAPVVLKAPSHDAAAQAQRLWIELANRRLMRVTLEEGDEVVLNHQGAEIRAPMVQYQLPPANSGQRLGALAARGGAGRLRAVVDPAKPAEILEVTWKDAMQLVRRNGQPVLVLDGRPTVEMIGTGKLWADRLQVFLRELPRDPSQAAPAGPADAFSASVVPEQITASGRVAIESPELSGKVNQLEIKIESMTEGQSTSAAVSKPGTAANGQPAPSSVLPNPLVAQRGGPQRKYDVAGVTLKAHVAMRNRQAEVRTMNLDGGVVFREVTSADGSQPLSINAEHLRLTQADTPQPIIEIRGAGGQNGLPMQLVEIQARGAKLRAPLLTINRGTNQAWINSPGELELLVDRDLAGNPLPRPEPLTVTWQDSMKLDGRQITFTGDVVVQQATGWLQTRTLVVQTTQPVSFDGGSNQEPQLEQLECRDGAVAEFEQRDVSGVSSRQRVELKSLIANQVTGALSGEGPGVIDSVHLAKGAGQLFALPEIGAAPPAPGLMEENPQLRHLHIDFVRNVTGNLHTRTVNVHGDVRAVYGPVESWEERLSMSPGGGPRPDEVWITCDTLGVTQSPAAQIGPANTHAMELNAEKNVHIESIDPKQGAFTAYGHRATYDQTKGLFILSGDGRSLATIERQQYPGGPRSPNSAQRIEYNHKTGRIVINGLQQMQDTQIGR